MKGGQKIYDKFLFDIVNANTPSNTYAAGPENFDNLSFNQVPIPAAAWLLGSGLIGLVGIRRKFSE